MNPVPVTSTTVAPPTQGGGYQGSRNNNSVLWLGDVDPEMDEDFIQESFRMLNVSTTYVKVIRDRETGNPLGYAFVGFDKEETAKRVLEQFNGQLVPNSGAGRKFKMNTAGKNSLNRGFKPNHTRYSGYTSPPNHGDHSTSFNDYHHRPKVYSHGNPTAPNHQSQFQSGHQQPQSLPPSSQQVGSAGSDATTVSAVATPITVAANNTTTSSNSSSGNSSGPVSGGSSGSGISGNTPAQPSSSLRVDNWNPDSLTSTSGQSSGRNSQERGTSGSQERGTSGSQERGTQESGNSRSVEYTAFIGSLDYAISSDALMATFKARYPSVTSGKVILEESSGQSKGFGFVRFTSQAEYKAALEECNGQPMFGGRGIRISEAHPKPPRSSYGSIQSSDSQFGGHFVGRVGRGQPFRSSDQGVSNGKTMGGKGNSYVGPRDPSQIDQQKINDRIKLMDQVQNGPWYGKQSDGTLLPGPGHNPRNHQQQSCQQGVSSHSIPFGIGVSDLNGAPIMQMPDGSAGYAGYPYWTPSPYGQSIPTGYPNPMDHFSLPANGPPPPAYWSTGTGPNGQPIIFATDPNQMYHVTDYTGSVPAPFPNVPFTDQTAHMFVPPGMMQQPHSQQLHQVPSTVPASNNGIPNNGIPNNGIPSNGIPNNGIPNSGIPHRSFMANGPDLPHSVITAPGGPTPPSDTEQHPGIVIPVPGALAGNGWPQN